MYYDIIHVHLYMYMYIVHNLPSCLKVSAFISLGTFFDAKINSKLCLAPK